MSDGAGFDARRIALVVARTTGGAPGDPVGEEVATGYFLTEDLVLTVRHVAEGRNVAFQVRPEAGAGRSGLRPATRVWAGVGEVDAMLLRTGEAVGPGWVAPEVAAPADRGKWLSSGFLQEASDPVSGRRGTKPLEGSFAHTGGQTATMLSLTHNLVVAPGRQDSVKGVSGAPVFDRASGQLLGIVIDSTREYQNELRALPMSRLWDDVVFRSVVRPSFLGALPSRPWCLVLTAERSADDLPGSVDGVISRYKNQDEAFRKLADTPVHVPVVEAISSVENWIATVRALAAADFLIAEVTGFEPAVMLLLGIRSVVRRGVTVSVSGTGPDPHQDVEHQVPFNVQETRVLALDSEQFQDELRQAMTEGWTTLQRDPNYLDLPAFHGVRAPRPEMWKQEDGTKILVLCPFNPVYSAYFKRSGGLRAVVQDYTGGRVPERMLDLRSPRLVGQALYEQIRWATLCLVDWTGWRPNVFFELGVRLACAERDPLCLIDSADDRELVQHAALRELLGPVGYRAEQVAVTRETLKPLLRDWSSGRTMSQHRRSHELPPGATFAVTQESIDWAADPALDPPHVELRRGVEQLFGADVEQHPEKLVLFSDNAQFYAALRAAAREKWISSWLYLRHRCADDERGSRDWEEFLEVSAATLNALVRSTDPRHQRLCDEVRAVLGEDAGPRDVGPAGEGVRATLDAVKGLKQRAKSARNENRLPAALDDLDQTLRLLDRGIAEATAEATRAEMISQRADSFGMIGGVERRWGLEEHGYERRRHLEASVEAYDSGFAIEAELATGAATTYNRINRLVGRVLLDPQHLTDAELDRGLADAQQIVDDQLSGPRAKEPWAFADLVTIKLLRGDGSWAASLTRLEELSPPVEVYESMLTTLRPLAASASVVRPDLAAAVDRVQRSARNAS